MEAESKKYIAVDTMLHGRFLRPTDTFEKAEHRAVEKGSNIIRVYGTPVLVLDRNTNLIYLRYQFSKDITEKILNGTLIFPKNITPVIDKETQKLINDKEKRKLKNSTKVWHKQD
jgi:hypothetical protein